MQQKFRYKIMLFVFLFSSIFAGAVFAADFTAFTGQINADNINVRVDATVNSTVVCTISKGQLVEVVSEVYDWYKIRLPKAAPSYIKKDLVECINNNSAKCFNAKVTRDRVNIRLEPSKSSWIIGKADKLTVVNIIHDEDSWYKIEPIYQSYGWVNRKFIDKNIIVFKEEGKQTTANQQVALATGGQTTANQQISQPLDLVVEGTISPYGVVLWRKATHKLVTNSKKIYFLKGNRKGLDSLNYCKVKVTGKLINPKNSRYPIIEVAIIEVLN
ncbi:MAG: SH3 domain-containing protein [Candidatus Omnitrophica bacterium]|nr:SH3 domain-containing protein [Candidatus Omnitrophota bacterium]MBU1923436.1 SH3 domain-containing protein [Candidatus Omnitrophota bacterium]